MVRHRVYRCRACGWVSSSFGTARELKSNSAAVDEVRAHYAGKHPEVSCYGDNFGKCVEVAEV